MKKIVLSIVLVLAIALFAYAAGGKGKVVAVDGNKVTIEISDHGLKVGDAVKIDVESADGKAKGFKMKGC